MTDTKTEPDPTVDPDETKPDVDKDTLRELIREEIAKAKVLKPGSEPEDESGEEDDEEDDEEDTLTLRQITNRSLKLTAAALDRIPGSTPKTRDPKPEPEKKPVSRVHKFMGWVVDDDGR